MSCHVRYLLSPKLTGEEKVVSVGLRFPVTSVSVKWGRQSFIGRV